MISKRVGKEIKMHSLFWEAVLLIVLLQPELVIVLIFCVCWSFTTVRVMAHYLQFLTFLLCVILLVLLLPLQDHQEMMIIKTDSKFFGSWLGYEWQYRWCLSCWTACFWPIPFIYQILYSSQRAADKIYCGCSLLYCDWIRSTIYGAHGSQCCCRCKSHSHYGRKAYIFWLLKYLINFSFKTLSRLFWGALQSLDIIKNCSKPLNDRCGAADGS